MLKTKILGVQITSAKLPEVLEIVSNSLKTSGKKYIMTPNPEIVLMAQKDKLLKKIINEAFLSIPDGNGLNLLRKEKLTIIPGRKLMLELVKLAKANNLKTFFVSKNGPLLDKEANPVSEVDTKIEIDIIKEINKLKPDLLFVGMSSPKEQKWIHKHLAELNVKIAIQVGAGIDYLEGRVKLPPQWLDNLGLEWFWRLLSDPKRYKRIYNATVLFPLAILKDRLVKNQA